MYVYREWSVKLLKCVILAEFADSVIKNEAFYQRPVLCLKYTNNPRSVVSANFIILIMRCNNNDN